MADTKPTQLTTDMSCPDPDPIRLMCGCTINPNTGKWTRCPTDQARHEAQTADALDWLARAANLPPLTDAQREQLRDQDT